MKKDQSIPQLHQNDPKFQTARAKIEQFMISQDVNLSVLFNVIDTDSNRSLSKSEFKQKLRALHMGLQEEELEALFREIDKDKSDTINEKEFVMMFAAINTA